MNLTSLLLPRQIAARILLGLGLALLFLLSGYRLPPAAAADQPVATGARIGGDGIRTRFVADLSQAGRSWLPSLRGVG